MNSKTIQGILFVVAILGSGFLVFFLMDPARDTPEFLGVVSPTGDVGDSDARGNQLVKLVTSVFPDSFVLSENEIPEGFTIVPWAEKYLSVGLETNPGFLGDTTHYSELFEGIDITKISQVYTSIYSGSNEYREFNFGIDLIQFNSSNDLNSEIPTFLEGKNSKMLFLRSSEIFVFIWTNSSEGEDLRDLEDFASLFEGNEALGVERVVNRNKCGEEPQLRDFLDVEPEERNPADVLYGIDPLYESLSEHEDAVEEWRACSL